MKTKKYEIAVCGEEIVYHKRHLRIEVPEDATDEEVFSLQSSALDCFGSA